LAVASGRRLTVKNNRRLAARPPWRPMGGRPTQVSMEGRAA